MNKVGYVFHPVYLEHDTGAHIENSSRLKSVITHLEKTGVLSELIAVSPRAATTGEIASVHDLTYIAYVNYVSRKGGAWLEVDTVISGKSFDAATCAAGGLIEATRAVVDGKIDSAFALVRPPGHHATFDRAEGFCIFNNIAIAANYALDTYHLERIAIIDFDVHHGNGTQRTFYSDPRVLYVSTHQFPHYPGTGRVEDTGEDAGKGTTLNIPLPVGCGDDQFKEVFHQLVVPAVRRYHPQLIMVSTGYDTHWADELAQMQMTTTGFGEIMLQIKQLADEFCRGKLVLTLEGGYHLEALATSVKATFDILLGKPSVTDGLGPSQRRITTPDIRPLINYVRQIHHL